MRYFCLVYTDEAEWEALSIGNKVALRRECLNLDETFRRSGRCLAAGRLEPVQTATTVRIRGGHVVFVDGPFAETKEQLAGFYLIEAENLDEALEVAQRIPPARIGNIEVRPVRELEP